MLYFKNLTSSKFNIQKLIKKFVTAVFLLIFITQTEPKYYIHIIIIIIIFGEKRHLSKNYNY